MTLTAPSQGRVPRRGGPILARAFLVPLLILAACAPSLPKGVDKDALDEAVGSAIGDAGTCVLLLDKASGKTVWKYGTYLVCDRVLPSCVGQATQSINEVAAAALKGNDQTISCNSVPDGSRGVGWASGPAGDPAKGLIYAAVLESDRSLPGREIKLRVEKAFTKAGL